MSDICFCRETDVERQKAEADRARQELDKIGGDLKKMLAEDIKENKVKLDPAGNNDGITVANVASSQAEVGCLPGEQKIENYCGEYSFFGVSHRNWCTMTLKETRSCHLWTQQL